MGVHVRPKQSFLAELFYAHITDERFLVGGRAPLTLFNFFACYNAVDFSPVVLEVVLLARFPGAEENCATATHKKLVIDGWCVFGN